ncbi:hypothetical protein [Chelatococcus reniformis]|uniref:Uncharacterized protein n=1 Tax=Chelatococcus reniformis TaxID=1494448 RepID=A0A916TWU7_9HYPH|nr:hypothetical protein [Chelatococcus reniformis]GGC47638.1 hypothetical protein GCM10010994_03520 [Chelatococcus reniformis]
MSHRAPTKIIALAAAAASLIALAEPAAAQYRRPYRAPPQPSVQQAPPGMVNIGGRWVSSAWCDATVPSGGGSGGPAGPGSGLCSPGWQQRGR